MEFETRKTIKNLEEQIEKSYSLPIFRGYAAVDKRGVEKFIDTIYASLPSDVIRARKFLENRDYKLAQNSKNNNHSSKKSGIYDCLNELESTFAEAFQFKSFAIVSIKDIEKIIDRINDSIPEEIVKAENFNK